MDADRRQWLRERILSDVERNQSSIKELARIYDEYHAIPRRETRAVIREMLAEGIIVRVDEVDCWGKKVDWILKNEE